MGKVIAICVSEKRGTAKKPIEECNVVEGYGIENDAHGGDWHRQISLLSYDKVIEFNNRGGNVTHGAFGENLLVEGIDFKSIPIGTKFKCNEVILELTQIGKECHSHCEIFKRVGECIMPREGVFAKVINGGEIRVGDELYICLG